MMRITLIAAGKLREHYLKDAVAEYAKRLSRYCKLEIIEVADEKTPEHVSDRENRLIREREGERMLRCLPKDSYAIALAVEGDAPDSVGLAKKLDLLGQKGVSHITFLIGGSLGLSDDVMARADYALSFSRMTFPHQLMRVILLEQIYRSFKIIRKEPYHK